MLSFYSAAVEDFLDSPNESISGALSERIIQQFAGDESRQLKAWKTQIELLETALQAVVQNYSGAKQWGILFEFPMLRLQRRLDIVVLSGGLVVVIEFKVGDNAYVFSDLQQVEDYALDLRDFHEASHALPILPVLCASEARQNHIHELQPINVSPCWKCNGEGLFTVFESLYQHPMVHSGHQINIEEWESSPYRPVPSIIEAAELLYAGHEVREIAHASSAPDNLSATTDRLIEIIHEAHQNHQHIVAFVTGVPGSGKTLAGLNAVARFQSVSSN